MRTPLSGAAAVLIAAASAVALPGVGSAGEDRPAICQTANRARAPLSAGALNALELLCHGESPASADGPAPRPSRLAHPVATNVRVNDPTLDPTVPDGTHLTQSEVTVATSGSNTVMAFNDTTHLFDGGSASQTGYAVSPNGGLTWQDRGEVPTAGGTTFVLGDPVLDVRSSDGSLFLANLFCTGGSAADRCPIGVSRSTDGGQTFGAPAQTWPTMPTTDIADKPWLAVDNGPSSPRAGRVYVIWSHFNASGDSVIMMTSSPDGVTWAVPTVVSDPTCAPASGFGHAGQGSQIAVAPTGVVYASWWCFGDTSFQIRFDRSFDGGVTWGTDRIVRNFTEPSGDRIIDCGRATPSNTIVYNGDIRWNDFPSMAVDPVSGTIHVVWTEDPDGFGAGADDAAVLYSRSTDGGTGWFAPVILGSHTTDQFFPMVRTDPAGTVGVAWYDRRNDPGNLLIDVYLVTSSDAGATFSDLHRVTTQSFGVNKTRPSFDTATRNCYMGDYNGMVGTTGGRFLLGWGDNRDPGPPANNGVDPNIYSGVHTPEPPGNGNGDDGGGTVRSELCTRTREGSGEREILVGDGRKNRMCGFGGSDVLRGKGGNDTLLGGGGNDSLSGGPGTDLLKGSGGRDVAVGGGGSDRCLSSERDRSC
jgi:hypothetical protein